MEQNNIDFNNNYGNSNLKEPNKKNSLLIILIFLVLVLIGLFCYKMFVVDKKINGDSNVVNKDNNIVNKDNNIMNKNDNKVDKDKVDDNKVKTIYDSGIKKVDNGKQKETFNHYLSKQPVVTVYLDNQGNAYLKNHFDIISDDVLGKKEKLDFYGLSELDDDAYEASKSRGMDYIDAYKLQDNIRSIAIYHKGNGGTTVDIVLISKDNKASIYELVYDSNRITNVSIKKNAINDIIGSKEVELDSSRGYHLIDINNNEYSVEF